MENKCKNVDGPWKEEVVEYKYKHVDDPWKEEDMEYKDKQVDERNRRKPWNENTNMTMIR